MNTKFQVVAAGQVVGEFVTFGDAHEAFKQVNGGDPFPKAHKVAVDGKVVAVPVAQVVMVGFAADFGKDAA